jgi:subtilisin family serine protease
MQVERSLATPPMRLARGPLWMFVLLLAVAEAAGAAPREDLPAATQGANPAKLGGALEDRLRQPWPEAGIAVGVALRGNDLPRQGKARRAAIKARQDRVLEALSAHGFLLKRRYESVSGFAGWAQPAAIDALLDHPESELIYLDGRVGASLAESTLLIGANEVHALGFTGAGIRVAVLDSGIDTNHPHLADDLAAQRCFCDDHPSPNRGCCPGNRDTGSNAEDNDGHGTSVSGIVTSSNPDGIGVAPDAEIVAVKVLNDFGGGSFSDVAAGLDWVLTQHAALGISVVNLSLGDGIEHGNSGASPCSGTNTANAIADLHAAGVAVFVASGNEAFDNGISFPACVTEAISVGGVYDAAHGHVSWCGNSSCSTTLCRDSGTAADMFVCHTNSDQLLDILAPNYRIDTTALGGGRTAFGGTSASSSFGAAMAALLLEADASLTPEQIRTLLKTNGPLVLNPENGLSFRRSDVAQSLAELPEPSSSLLLLCGCGMLILLRRLAPRNEHSRKQSEAVP